MSVPKRIQRKRKAGWRMPEGAVYVGRPSKWGNPFVLGSTQVRRPALDGSAWEIEGRLSKASGERSAYVHGDGHLTWHQVELATAEQVVELFRSQLMATLAYPVGVPNWTHFRHIREALGELRGKDLACWCPLDQPCHADVLLDLANGGAA